MRLNNVMTWVHITGNLWIRKAEYPRFIPGSIDDFTSSRISLGTTVCSVLVLLELFATLFSILPWKTTDLIQYFTIDVSLCLNELLISSLLWLLIWTNCTFNLLALWIEHINVILVAVIWRFCFPRTNIYLLFSFSTFLVVLLVVN